MHSNHQPLILSKLVQAYPDEQSVKYGKFHIEPLERGFGTVIGNALRRTLLSSLQGAAIVSIRVKGAPHEFSAIPGVTEDLADIVLKLKGVRLKLHSSQATIGIKQHGTGEVTAGNIITGNNVEVMNPDHYIATCGNDADFEVEMQAKTGKGFVLADRNRESAPINTIWLDANFSPIKKVNFSVSESSVGTDPAPAHDRLTLEVWTDGSVKPIDAVAYAARILQDQLTIFAGFDLECERLVDDEPIVNEEVLNENLYRKISEFELSVRAANCIASSGLKFVGELAAMKKSEVRKLQKAGQKTVDEFQEILASVGLDFGMNVGDFPDPDPEIIAKIDVE